MKLISIHPTFATIRWICLLAAIVSPLYFFTYRAAAQEPAPDLTATSVMAAQEPTAVPTPTPAPTWTPGPAPTNAAPTPGVPVAPTPSNGATPTGRLVDFRVDDEEINSGDCVQFSWVVRGDVDRVEFDQEDDNKDSLLVSNLDDREECPVEETTYALIVRWLDGTKTRQEIEISLDTSSDGSDSDDGDSSNSSGGSSGSGTSSEVGEFIPVTPILITTVTPTPQIVAAAPPAATEPAFQQAAYQDMAGTQPVVVPASALSSVKVLPETGKLPQSTPEDKSAAPHTYWIDWLAFTSGLLLVISSASLGLVFARILRRSS